MVNVKTKEATKQIYSGAQLLIHCLEKQEVEMIFGYPGGAVLPIYDALYDANIPNILTRHEQGAVHAAQGYAKATGKPGVVLVTSGPGATNVVTGIADAMADSTPLIVITGQVASPVIGKDAFQEADILGITLPITKHNYQVRNIEDLETTIAEAFHIATTGRKGPVVIDLPKDMTLKLTEAETTTEKMVVSLPTYQPNLNPSSTQIKRLMSGLQQAKRPLLLIGAGITAAQGEWLLREFVEKYELPVVSTLLGLGILPTSSPYFLGMGGMHGSYAANMALAECDFLVNIGSRFDDRLASCPPEFAPHATIAHIDIDPAEIGKVIRTDIPIVGDAKVSLEQLLSYPYQKIEMAEWQELCQTRQTNHPFGYDRANTSEIKPQKVIEQIGEITKGDAFVITDVGQHQMWVAQYYPFNFAKQLITSGGLGTMGYGIPAGVGAQFAHPDRDVVVFVGDGGFQMTNQELAILNEYQLNVKFVILNNGSLGMVRQWQERFHQNRLSASVFNTQPDFMKLSEAYGIKGTRLVDPQTLVEDLNKAFTYKGPQVIEVIISSEEHVLPMVPSGMPNHKMIGVEGL
ncbi:biosynthetic-type acetolactate synthase large subunit [Enterococcus alcedinis]|uniref:Acetolactate synthase n=1 Tax=Enterococcus alcedinis TaxID=1274384 RepID=A0A917JJE4_9ENTE|nr:biosynthetic-type acetolactate synthase large subunit [Enterococcus alcedinis]MBP2103258.1 acetolactate synthase large subunit [Enterococcus alcedinis]GGI66806.1 acetolactate synthase [Enterococcus alcedinis]